MKRTQVYLTHDQDRRLGEIAEERGTSRAGALRWALDMVLETGDAGIRIPGGDPGHGGHPVGLPRLARVAALDPRPDRGRAPGNPWATGTRATGLTRVIVLDTSVLIAHLRGDDRATSFLLAIPTAGSVGERPRPHRGRRWHAQRTSDVPWRACSACMRLLPVTDQIARRAGEMLRAYRRSHSGIDLVDYAVAATAEVHGARLATLNVKHFPMFPDLVPPY